jgi:hypothetical protein
LISGPYFCILKKLVWKCGREVPARGGQGMHHFYDVQKGGVAERFPPEADRECIVFVSNKMEGWQRGSRQRRTGNASFSFQIKWRVGREVPARGGQGMHRFRFK